MNFNKFTIKAQEAIQEAAKRTQALGQQAIEPIHILGGIMHAEERITSFLLQKTGANLQQITAEIAHEEQRLPKVSGGEPYLSRQSNEVLTKQRTLPARWATSMYP